jgi:sulfur-carrier protein adenylyltransferase/sulfurtransferase
MEPNQISSPMKSLDGEHAREYIANHKEGTYTLLDVRQPGEYALEHLPGATLIPLPELTDAAKEIEHEKPMIVY